MIQLTVLYKQPQDPAAFDSYYQEVHVPLAKKLPGLKGFTSNKPRSITAQAPAPYYRMDTLYFEDMAALPTTFQSSEGQAVANDVPKFATGGATIVVGELEVSHQVSLS